MKVHYNLLAGASALALAWAATPAFAADAAPSTAVDTKNEVDTLIVTARRQAENLQDVPETVVPLTSSEV